MVLFFRLDSGPESPFRRDLEHNGRLCDLAVFYKSGGPAVLCLVELKSGGYEDAADQLIETKRALLREFGRDPRKRSIDMNIVFKCCIVRHSSVPIDKRVLDKINKRLKEEFGDGRWMVLSKKDIGEFLRAGTS
ncbi:MAG: hypothetical protein N3G75_08760 [Methanothrix sp.]|nr:hypothetical protein [Methanothrix sp.]MCX8207899.1 hypothetical protein [Methanothrix sp.]